MVDIDVSFGAVTLPTGAGATFTLYEDTDQDGTAETSKSTTLTDGTTSYTLSGFNGNSSDEYWWEIKIEHSDITADNAVSVPVDVSISTTTLFRFSSIEGSGELSNGRSITAKERASKLTGDGELTDARGTTKPRSSTLAGDAELSAERLPVNKERSLVLTGEGEISNSALFRETFPSELTRGLDWDFNFDRDGFESSWLYQDGSDGAGSVALYAEGTFGDADECTPTVVIDFDRDGDGDVDERSQPRRIPATDKAVVFPELSGESGYYRVLLRDLRPADILTAITFGPTHT